MDIDPVPCLRIFSEDLLLIIFIAYFEEGK